MRTLALLLALLLPSLCLADGQQAVVVSRSMVIDGDIIDGDTTLSMAAGAATTYSSSMLFTRTEYLSVSASVTTTQDVALSLLVQSSDNNVEWVTKATLTMNATATVPLDIEAVSIPVSPYVRFGILSDATYPVTYKRLSAHGF